MTNYEKYKNLVISCVLQDSICELAYKAYEGAPCDRRTCVECCKFTAEWLSREDIEIDWEKVPIDTPVLIKSEHGILFRHFAEYCHGMVGVYASGLSSWTSDGQTELWEPEYVDIGRPEELIKYAKQ